MTECFLCGHPRPCRCDRIARNTSTVEAFFTGRNVAITLQHPETLGRFEQRIRNPDSQRPATETRR